MEYKDFIRTVAERAALSREEAADLTRATLEMLGDRLSAGEAHDLAYHLPEPLDQSLRIRNRSAKDQGARNYGLDEVVRRVSARTGLNLTETTNGVRAVLTTLRESVDTVEFDQAMSQLPGEFRRTAEAT
jgi:uncharacterized protein (DUF2267 family)